MVAFITGYFKFILASNDISALTAFYIPTTILGLNLLMPTENSRDWCSIITGLVCGAGFIVGSLASCGMILLVEDYLSLAIGMEIVIISVVSAINIKVGSKLRVVLDRKAHRKLISILLIFLFFIIWSGFFFVIMRKI